MKRNLQVLDLSRWVPPARVKKVKLRYETDSPVRGQPLRVILYRTPDDPNPIILTGKQGQCEIDLKEPQRIYYEIERELNFKPHVLGFQLDIPS